jgi:hypothetical protein
VNFANEKPLFTILKKYHQIFLLKRFGEIAKIHHQKKSFYRPRQDYYHMLPDKERK